MQHPDHDYDYLDIEFVDDTGEEFGQESEYPLSQNHDGFYEAEADDHGNDFAYQANCDVEEEYNDGDNDGDVPLESAGDVDIGAENSMDAVAGVDSSIEKTPVREGTTASSTQPDGMDVGDTNKIPVAPKLEPSPDSLSSSQIPESSCRESQPPPIVSFQAAPNSSFKNFGSDTVS